MTDRDKLAELLAGYYGVDPGYYGVDAYGIADHFLSNGVTFQKRIPVFERLPEEDLPKDSKWIPVTERLPDVECIAVGLQDEMLIGYVYASAYENTGYAAESDGEILHNITHWMPLPEPPKEQN